MKREDLKVCDRFRYRHATWEVVWEVVEILPFVSMVLKHTTTSNGSSINERYTFQWCNIDEDFEYISRKDDNLVNFYKLLNNE